MINSTYNPVSVNDFEKTKLTLNIMGTLGTAAHGTTTNIDFKLTDDNLLTGAIFQCKDANWGDSVTIQVVDVDGIVYPAGSVLAQFVTNWYVVTDDQRQISMDVNYPAKIIAGLYLRVVYKSTGSTDVGVAGNYMLHKVLV